MENSMQIEVLQESRFYEEVTDNEKLKSYLDSLSIKEHEIAVSKIMNACDVARLTVYGWKAGRSKIRKPFKKAIEEALNQKIFD